MDIETIGLLGFVFAAVALAAMAYERRMDVLYGSYLEDRASEELRHSARRLWQPSVIDRLRWEARNVIYLASIIAC
jgi:nitric oxide synthase oxygenase domain/subunit